MKKSSNKANSEIYVQMYTLENGQNQSESSSVYAR